MLNFKKEPKIIQIRIENKTPEEADRIGVIIEQQLNGGVFEIAGGKAILNFDKDKNLQNIKKEYIAWKRKKT